MSALAAAAVATVSTLFAWTVPLLLGVDAVVITASVLLSPSTADTFFGWTVAAFETAEEVLPLFAEEDEEVVGLSDDDDDCDGVVFTDGFWLELVNVVEGGKLEMVAADTAFDDVIGTVFLLFDDVIEAVFLPLAFVALADLLELLMLALAAALDLTAAPEDAEAAAAAAAAAAREPEDARTWSMISWYCSSPMLTPAPAIRFITSFM